MSRPLNRPRCIQLALLESLVEKVVKAELTILALPLEDLSCTPELFKVMSLHEEIDANLKALHFAI
ncbi:MAG: hypothetical protein ACXWT4_17360 [Methylobacter sp.]